MKQRKLWSVFVGLSLITLLSGCGGDALGRKEISGTVTIDGQPVKSGSVSFTPTAAGGISSGAVVTDGKFKIARDQGLPVGKYRVELHATDGTEPELKAGHMPGDELPPPPPDLIPAEWNVDSKETIEVKDGPNDFTFAVTSKATGTPSTEATTPK